VCDGGSETKAEQFAGLHVSGNPVVLFNVWDAGSAKAVTSSGAKAIATSSWAVAAALGFADGEKTPFELVIDNLERIVRATELPVSADLESGYGSDPEAVGVSVRQAIEAGAIGCNLEDSFPDNGRLRDSSDQASRIHSVREAGDSAGIQFFINARSDVFFQPNRNGDDAAADAIARAHTYFQAGADSLFLPGLTDLGLIAKIAKASPLPINILVGAAGPSFRELAGCGVARISYGNSPYADLLNTFEMSARRAYSLQRTSQPLCLELDWPLVEFGEVAVQHSNMYRLMMRSSGQIHAFGLSRLSVRTPRLDVAECVLILS
jgi:2-methylisocitrate lyase-like PEP mutase family enzyme